MSNNREIKEKMRKQLNDDIYLTSLTKKSFDAADKNHNGTIDIKELKSCMVEIAQGLGCGFPKDQVIIDEFYKLDTNRNNTIDFNEFKVFVKKNMLILIDRIPE